MIGSGGKVIRELQERTGTTINIEDDGSIQIVGAMKKDAEVVIDMIHGIVAVPEIGSTYDATVKTITDFGAFVEFLPGKEGLVHISELEHRRVNKVEDIIKMGETFPVKVIGFDRNGKIKLSRKALIVQPEE